MLLRDPSGATGYNDPLVLSEDERKEGKEAMYETGPTTNGAPLFVVESAEDRDRRTKNKSSFRI